jgi:hypothetical protein
MQESYVDTLCQEIDVAAAAADRCSHEPLRTVFFGGGTPSLLPPNLLVRLLDKLNEHFGIQSGAEIAMEMDPGTFDEAKLRAFVAAGVNRLSMGVQVRDVLISIGLTPTRLCSGVLLFLQGGSALVSDTTGLHLILDQPRGPACLGMSLSMSNLQC